PGGRPGPGGAGWATAPMASPASRLADTCSTLDCRTAFQYHDADGMDPRPTALARRPRDHDDFRRRRARRLRGDAAVDAAARVARGDRQRRHRLGPLRPAFDLPEHGPAPRRPR